jgi:hypothetical protein
MGQEVWFEQRSPTGRVRLRQGTSCPDPKGFFLYLDDVVTGRYAGIVAARKAFRQLADVHDPPRPVVQETGDARNELGDEMAHAYFASMRGQGQGKGGRSKVKRG